MDLNNVYVIDIECDGFLDELTKLHVMSASYIDSKGKWQIISTPDNDTEKEKAVNKIFSNPNNTIVGHYFIGFDIRALKKLYPHIKFRANIIDSLPLSWYLYNERTKHGLEDWGVDLGHKKEEVGDDEWKNLNYIRAKERCEGDVIINTKLWVKQLRLLKKLYDNDDEAIIRKIRQTNFKIELQVIQDDNKIKLDVDACKKNLAILEDIIKEKVEDLKSIMPKVPKYVSRKKPRVLYKKNGDLSVAGERWMKLVHGCGLSEDYEGEIKEEVSREEPNPQSTKQMKEFLLSRGWKPKLFKEGANGPVPQLRDDNKDLCSSITSMFDKYPELESLQGLSVATHRAAYLKAFLETANEEGYVTASWRGTAKTWRCKHVKPIVNLPSNNSQYGEYVRSVLVAPEGKVFVNADLSSLEDKTKQVGIYDLDRDYVETLNVRGYDAHLDIAVRSGFMTNDEAEFFKWYKGGKEGKLPEVFSNLTEEELSDMFEKLTKVRSKAKTTNYAATYNASPKKIAQTADMTLKEAEKFHGAYWDLNWSIKKLTDSFEIKTVDDREWIYSPFSKTWLLLTASHIKFSAVNQNFGAFVFDLWMYYLIKEGVKPIMSIHDEISWYINEGEEEETRRIVQKAIDKVNQVLDYPIKFEAEPEFAKSYGDVH